MPTAGATSGADLVIGTAGNDLINAGRGNDVVRAGAGDDVVFGGNGNDKLYGGAGGDVLNGGAGRDRLEGGAGDDVLNGAGGFDTLIGGGGADEFRLRQSEVQDTANIGFFAGHQGLINGWLRIGDLNYAEGDTLHITGFTNMFAAAGIDNSDHSLDALELQKLHDYLDTLHTGNKDFVREDNGGQAGTTLILTDDFGHTVALELAHYYFT